MNPWSQLMGNNFDPVEMHIKKYMFDILQERYAKNENFIERLIGVLKTSRDSEEFGTFIVDVYETGFLKAINEHKEALEARGLEANIVSEPHAIDEKSKIFPS